MHISIHKSAILVPPTWSTNVLSSIIQINLSMSNGHILIIANCRYCMDFNHVRPEHSCHPIEKVAEEHRKALQSCCDVLIEKQPQAEKLMEDVVAAEKALKKSAEDAKAKISQQKNDIIKAVEDVFQGKINEVDKMYNQHERKVVAKRKKVEAFLDSVKCAESISKNVLEKGSNEEIIESQKMIQERVEIVKKKYESVNDMQKVAAIDKNWFLPEKVDTDMISKLFGGMYNFHCYLTL